MTRVHPQEVMMAACSDSCYLLSPCQHSRELLHMQMHVLCECVCTRQTDRDKDMCDFIRKNGIPDRMRRKTVEHRGAG
jgi:hypothetical protein